MEQKKEKQNIAELAHKKRHIHLLSKLQSNKPLTKSEIRELEELEGSAPPDGIVRTAREVAKFFHVSARTVDYWIRDGLPRTEQGYFNLDIVRIWRMDRDRKKEKTKDPNDPEVRFRSARARLAEIELAKRMGDLLPREEVESEWLNIIITLKKSLLGLPKRLAPQLVGLDAKLIQSALSKHIRELLENLTKNKKV